jgi:hypothetical protein
LNESPFRLCFDGQLSPIVRPDFRSVRFFHTAAAFVTQQNIFLTAPAKTLSNALNENG